MLEKKLKIHDIFIINKKKVIGLKQNIQVNTDCNRKRLEKEPRWPESWLETETECSQQQERMIESRKWLEKRMSLTTVDGHPSEFRNAECLETEGQERAKVLAFPYPYGHKWE